MTKKCYPAVGSVRIENGRWVRFRSQGEEMILVLGSPKEAKEAFDEIQEATTVRKHVWLLDGEEGPDGPPMYFDYSTAKHKPRRRKYNTDPEVIAERAMGYF